MSISTLLTDYLADTSTEGRKKLAQLRAAITEVLNDEQDFAPDDPEWGPVRLIMRDDTVGGGLHGNLNKGIIDLSKRMAYIKQQNEIISEQATAGFILVSSFEDGATLTLSNEVLLYEADGQYYRWTGDLPKVVDANSTPDLAGGIGGGKWVLVGDGALRSQLKLDSGATMVSTETGLTVQDEINKKTADIQQKTKEIEILQYPVDLYFCTFFESNDNTRIKLGISTDGINFSDLVVLKNDDSELRGRDPSIIYHNGYFLIAVTGAEGDYDFTIYRSKDLVTWETIKCRLGDNAVKGTVFGEIVVNSIWAPELVLDENNDLYVSISIQYKANETDINGNSIPFFYPCLSKCTDIETLSFAHPEVITIESSHIGNKIDADIIYENNEYVMAIKNEFNKEIEIFKSSAMNGEYIYFSTVPFSSGSEGPCIVKRKSGDYVIYADFFATGRELFYVQTTDFLTFTQEQPLIAYDSVRHGTVSRTLGDPLVAQYLVKAVSVANSNSNKYLKYYGVNENTTIDLLPMDGFMYGIPGKVNATINLLPGAKEAYFCVGSGSWALLKLKNINGFPNNTLVLGCGYGHEQVVKIVKTPGSSTSYRAVGFSPILNSTSLYADAGNVSDINKEEITWYPMYGRIYLTSGSNQTINIHKLPTDLNNGFYFYICIRSGSAGGAVSFKKVGGNVAIPGTVDLTLSGNNGLDSKLIRIEFNAGTWFLQY